jgi:hypothetical protein
MGREEGDGMMAANNPGSVPSPWDVRRPGEPSAAVRRAVLERDCCCAGCETTAIGRAYAVRRRVRPWATDTPEPHEDSPLGWVLACDACHDACKRLDPVMRERGLWLWPGQDPAWEPVLYALRGTRAWFWLTDDGLRSTGPPEQRR